MHRKRRRQTVEKAPRRTGSTAGVSAGRAFFAGPERSIAGACGAAIIDHPACALSAGPLSDSELPAMDPKLLELLVCPVTKGPLTYAKETQELISRSARLAYPVRDGIPVLLENEARTLTDEELEA